MEHLSTEIKNKVLTSMILMLDEQREQLLAANRKDLDLFEGQDQSLYDRLMIDTPKITEMIQAIMSVKSQDDPVGRELSRVKLDNGLDVVNTTAPFGTIMIIYESRPDVTVEAAVLAFKAGSKILLKGGKEATNTNRALVECWHRALEANGLSKDWIQLFTMSREATQAFLKKPTQKLDLVVPRGGEKLIAFVKEHAQCAVLVSGRGNNFAYVARDADWEQTKRVILNAKTHKISACNALDKVLVDKGLPDFDHRMKELVKLLGNEGVQVMADPSLKAIAGQVQELEDKDWYEEFLAKRIGIGLVNGLPEAIAKINQYSGGHSAVILTSDRGKAADFMAQVDCAAVYHNASTRFTDGGQMGVGAELAISTDKLHHRGPLGLQQLVTNKFLVFGDGQVRV